MELKQLTAPGIASACAGLLLWALWNPGLPSGNPSRTIDVPSTDQQRSSRAEPHPDQVDPLAADAASVIAKAAGFTEAFVASILRRRTAEVDAQKSAVVAAALFRAMFVDRDVIETHKILVQHGRTLRGVQRDQWTQLARREAEWLVLDPELIGFVNPPDLNLEPSRAMHPEDLARQLQSAPVSERAFLATSLERSIRENTELGLEWHVEPYVDRASNAESLDERLREVDEIGPSRLSADDLRSLESFERALGGSVLDDKYAVIDRLLGDRSGTARRLATAIKEAQRKAESSASLKSLPGKPSWQEIR